MPIINALNRRLGYVVAVSGGAGLAPAWPGTVGAAVGAVLAAALIPASPVVVFLGCLLLFAIGVWASAEVVASTGQDDPQIVVIDETFGAAVTLCMLPPEPVWWILGFVAFRFFDIVKPWPIDLLQERVKGGLGIMLDDAAAAVAAAAFVLLLREATRLLV